MIKMEAIFESRVIGETQFSKFTASGETERDACFKILKAAGYAEVVDHIEDDENNGAEVYDMYDVVDEILEYAIEEDLDDLVFLKDITHDVEYYGDIDVVDLG